MGEAPLDLKVFDGKLNPALVHEVLWSYGQNRRAFTASTRTFGEVRGGGRKPWRQKGTGRARTSSIRAPHWKGGGTVFGPHPKTIRYHLPRKMRLGALRSVLNQKIGQEKLIIVDRVGLEKAKTKELLEGLKRLGATSKPLLVIETRDRAVERCGRNVPGLDTRTAQDLTAQDVASHDQCVFSREALGMVTQRLLWNGRTAAVMSRE